VIPITILMDVGGTEEKKGDRLILIDPTSVRQLS